MRLFSRCLSVGLAIFGMLTCWSVQAADIPDLSQGYVKVSSERNHIDVHADGSYLDSISYTYTLLNAFALDAIRKQTITYSTSMDDVKVLSAYTLKANGTKIPVPVENYQVETGSGNNSAIPLISDIAKKTIFFPNVEVGDSIVLSYQVLRNKAVFPGQFAFSHIFHNGYITDDSELSISAPTSLPIHVAAYGVQGGEIGPQEDGQHE